MSKSRVKKKLTKKQKVRYSIIGGILLLLLLIGAIIYKANSTNNSKKDEKDSYETLTVKEKDPLILKGIVQPKDTQYFNFDQSQGKISNISVQNGQNVKTGEVIATYQNATAEDQADEQSQSLDKFNLAVSNAQDNLNVATNKQTELETQLANARIDNDKASIEASKQALSAQKDVVNQAQQALDSANLDLSNASKSIERAQKRVTTTVTAPSDGIVYINEKGKVDPTVAYATLVSPETVVNGTVSEYDFKKVKKDQEVDIKSISDDKKIKGKVTNVNQLPETSGQAGADANKSSVSNYSFTVQPEENMQYGTNVQISIKSTTLEIPKSAVLKEEDGNYVFLYKDGKAKKQAVTVSEAGNVDVVNKGLNAKDVIIVKPDKEIKDGKEVKVADNK
ncbi:efflux RND transporter periplasmic adaptor subunit [Floricoccus penangensis]|uniref:efflux RND transporter periplasmic adaptor subunit n=1 Tax=Floricoccus penangensis TaxID=1859475 RepID=UPI00203EE385|nr:efflux RND transporter periplasmic adaptor subunit [Floricoccus penangensis]URZ88065.1 efflux RND transporter periplasmic adaptor subunit [Floricoccus penangensis]